MKGGVSIDFGKCVNKANFATQSGKTGGKIGHVLQCVYKKITAVINGSYMKIIDLYTPWEP